MALNTKHSYANRLYAHLTAAITSGASSLSFYPEEITNLLAGWQANSWLYLCIMDASGALEIVKMTALSGSTLAVERGQGGTTARAWAAGSLVASRAVAEYLTRYLQRGVFRSGAYNPNHTLEGEYTGEKFYQTGPALEQRRWWINTTGTKWRLLTGRPYTGELQDEWGYYYLPLPTEGTYHSGLGNDDGWYNSSAGQFWINDDYLVLGATAGAAAVHSFIRFVDIDIPAGATINTAYLTVREYFGSGGAVCNANIYFEDADETVPPANWAEMDAKPKTAPVAWNAIPAWTLGQPYQSPELKTILQTVVDRPAFGTSLTVYLYNNGSSAMATRAPRSFNGGPVGIPELHVEWDNP